jgi:hypothetical protein
VIRSRRRRQPGPLPVLLAGCAGAGALLAWELAQPLPGTTPALAAAEEPAAALAASGRAPTVEAPPGLAPLATLREVVERPLFSETRRPVPPEAPKETAPTKPLAASVLGIFLAPGARRAVLEVGQPPQVMRVGEGDRVEGWTVSRIASDSVELARGSARQEIRVKDRSAKGGPPKPRK